MLNNLEFLTKLLVLLTSLVGLVGAIIGVTKVLGARSPRPVDNSSPWQLFREVTGMFGFMLAFPAFLLVFMMLIKAMGSVFDTSRPPSDAAPLHAADSLLHSPDTAIRRLGTMYYAAQLINNVNRRDDAFEAVALAAGRAANGSIALSAASRITSRNRKDRVLDSLFHTFMEQQDYLQAGRAAAQMEARNRRDRAAAAVLKAVDSSPH